MTDPLGHERSQVGRDVLDAPVREADAFRPIGLWDVLGRTRVALGLPPLAAPALVFVPLGALAGPSFAGLIGLNALGHLYPVIAVALAALGIFVGFGVRVERASDRRLLAYASLEALVTILVVAIAAGLLIARWGVNLDVAIWPLALVLGICAAATSAGVARPLDPPSRHAAMRIADLDDALPIALGGFVLAVQVAVLPDRVWLIATLNLLVPLAIALAGWLLFERARDTAERTVFVVGVVALLGGSAAYLGGSALVAGMAAGLVWRYAPGQAAEIVAEDLRRLQHPLVVLLLIFAGATTTVGLLELWLASGYILTRLSGKLLGGWIVSRVAPAISPADLGSHLLPPGVMGLAFALNYHMVTLSGASSAVLGAVVLGTLVSEILAALALLGPRGTPRGAH